LHFILAMLAFGLTLFGPSFLLPYLSVFWLGMISMYVINGGCVITHFERYLTGEDYTIVDPFLTLLGIDSSNENRDKLTMMAVIITFLVGIIRMQK